IKISVAAVIRMVTSASAFSAATPPSNSSISIISRLAIICARRRRNDSSVAVALWATPGRLPRRSRASHSEAATEGKQLPARLQHRERLAAFAIQIEQHALLRIRLVQGVAERPQVRDLLPVHFGDHIFALNVLRGGETVL